MNEPATIDSAVEAASSLAAGQLFAVQYQLYWPFVVNVLRRLGVPAAGAEDAAQEVFLILLTRLAHLDPAAPLRLWLRAVALRVASNQRRALRRRNRWFAPDHVEPDDVAEAPSRLPDRQLERRELHVRLARAIERLPAKQREVLLLALVEQRTASEIGRLIQASPNTVSSRLRAARLECMHALAPSRVAR